MIKIIDTNAAKRNILSIRKQLLQSNQSDCGINAVLKDNAYGHGMRLAKYIEKEVNNFSVFRFSEAKDLRNFVEKDIFILGKMSCNDIKKAIRQNFIISCDSIQELQVISKLAKSLGERARVNILLNTGMNRFGANKEEFFEIIKHIDFLSNIYIEGIFSHLAESATSYHVQKQLKRFIYFAKEIKNNKKFEKTKYHISSSNSLDLKTNFRFDFVRCGLALYGYTNFEPIMKVAFEILKIREVKKGDYIGYLHNYKCPQNKKIAILNGGYANGLKNNMKYKMLINGALCDVIGKVCMDVCFLDITNVNAEIGDLAYLLWDKTSMRYLKDNMKISEYEVLTNFCGEAKYKYLK